MMEYLVRIEEVARSAFSERVRTRFWRHVVWRVHYPIYQNTLQSFPSPYGFGYSEKTRLYRNTSHLRGHIGIDRAGKVGESCEGFVHPTKSEAIIWATPLLKKTERSNYRGLKHITPFTTLGVDSKTEPLMSQPAVRAGHPALSTTNHCQPPMSAAQ